MWLLNFLPDWIFHLVFLVGVLGLLASLVLKFVPFISTYKLPIQAGAILLIAFGTYMEGGISNEAVWKQRVAEAEKKALEAEAKAAEANSHMTTQVVTKNQVVVQKQLVVQKEIEKQASDIDANCKVVPSLVNILNQSASARQGGTK